MTFNVSVSMDRDELRELLEENKRLRQQVTELQEHATRQVEERRANDLSWQVGEFHRAFGYPVRTTPCDMTQEETRFRLELISEEYLEVLDACGVDVVELKAQIKRRLESTVFVVDLPGFAKELGDLDYVVDGTRHTAGIPRQAVANEISRSNLAKAGGPKRADGKQLKPPGWTPPDIARVLIDHGWAA